MAVAVNRALTSDAAPARARAERDRARARAKARSLLRAAQAEATEAERRVDAARNVRAVTAAEARAAGVAWAEIAEDLGGVRHPTAIAIAQRGEHLLAEDPARAS